MGFALNGLARSRDRARLSEANVYAARLEPRPPGAWHCMRRSTIATGEESRARCLSSFPSEGNFRWRVIESRARPRSSRILS